MRRRGLTLIELLLSLTISVIVIMAASNAYITGLRLSRGMDTARVVAARQTNFEQRLSDLFTHAFIDPDATNLTCFFQSGDMIGSANADGNGISQGTQQGSGTDSSISFTIIGQRVPSTLLNSQDDFETNNEKYGPIGGATEVQLGLTPVGEGSGGQQGLFLRQQTPADSDPTQGGEEWLLSPDIDTIRFEFYDGTQWVTSWDTTTMGTRRLPASVRVTYQFRDDSTEHIFVIPIPTSDVTADNPLEQETVS